MRDFLLELNDEMSSKENMCCGILLRLVLLLLLLLTFVFVVEGVLVSVFVVAAVVEVFACANVEAIGDNGNPMMFEFKGVLNDAIGEVGDVSFPVENWDGEILPEVFTLDCFIDVFDTEFGLLVLVVFDDEEE